MKSLLKLNSTVGSSFEIPVTTSNLKKKANKQTKKEKGEPALRVSCN